MSRSRWWETPGRSLEAEQAWFEEEGLEFELDRALLEERGVVVFRGVLRLGERTTPAEVHYPPAYATGAHPTVVTPELKLGRHQGPDGSLCLDHPVLGETAPMYGAEAAQRAQRLWLLWETDREQLAREEADAPDPRAGFYPYSLDSGITLIDMDVTGYEAGFLRLGLLELSPIRGAVTQIRATEPSAAVLSPGDPIRSFAGPFELNGAWRRVSAPPPFELSELRRWVAEHHADLLDEQLRYARAIRFMPRHAQAQALLGFVYPDEGPKRGETHDAWLLVMIDPQTESWSLPQAFHLRREEQWTRQPQLRPLERKRVAVVGLGALGSPIGDLLAKAGVGAHFYIDHDIITVGNRIRHQLDLTDVGRAKVHGLANRALRVNPWANVEIQGARLGANAIGPNHAAVQETDDRLVSDLGECDLIINATANSVAGSYISQIGEETQTPVVHVWVSAGAWGARVLVQRPGRSGCLDCYSLTQKSPEGASVPPVSSDPEVEEVMDEGCADPTFTGPGFELTEAAAAATRVAVQLLLEDDGGYPPAEVDLLTLSFRDEHQGVPTTTATRLPIHPRCEICATSSLG